MTQQNDFFNTITPVSLSSSPNYSGLATSHIVAGNGIFTYAKTKLATKLVKESEYIINPDLPELESYVKFNEALPKIPLDAFYMMLAFYRKVYDQDGTEAQMNFYWNENNVDSLVLTDGSEIALSDIKGLRQWNNQLISYVPKQVNSGALTKVDNDEIYELLRQQMMPFVETHSHNTMAAFKSSTDENNSYADELQLVVGHITSHEFDFYNWVTIRGKQIDHLDNNILSQVIELPDTYRNPDLKELPEIPEEWMNQHSKKISKPTVKTKSIMDYNKYTDDEVEHYVHAEVDDTPIYRDYDLNNEGIGHETSFTHLAQEEGDNLTSNQTKEKNSEEEISQRFHKTSIFSKIKKLLKGLK